MNNDDQFPHNEETWLDWTTNRKQKIEADLFFALSSIAAEHRPRHRGFERPVRAAARRSGDHKAVVLHFKGIGTRGGDFHRAIGIARDHEVAIGYGGRDRQEAWWELAECSGTSSGPPW